MKLIDIDDGPWKILNSEWVGSDDHYCDVWLKVTGDFENEEEKQQYMQALCDKLNER